MFVVFEGPEGAGKSTTLKAVAQELRLRGRPITETREPGEGEFGRNVRELLLNGGAMSAEAELFLFLADRAEHVRSFLRPRRLAGEWVLCDRYAASTFVYQAVARGLNKTTVRAFNDFATGGLMPDLTLLLDVPAEVGLMRLNNPDRMDAEPLEFHRRVRQGFLDLAAQETGWCVIDATQGPEKVVGDALAAIEGVS